MTVAILWDIAPRSPATFGRYHLHLLSRISAGQETRVRLVARFLALQNLDPEDGGDIFLRNVDSHTDYTALNPGLPM
jgi:hypothetical protein